MKKMKISQSSVEILSVVGLDIPALEVKRHSSWWQRKYTGDELFYCQDQ